MGSTRPALAALAMLLPLGLSPAPTPAEPPPGGRYEDLVALFREWREFQKPRVEDGVPDYTPAAMAEQKARLPELQRRLAAIDPRDLPVAQQIDWRLVRAEMNGLEFDHRVLRPWSRNPSFYTAVIPDQSDTPAKEGPGFAGALELWRVSFPLPAAEVPGFRLRLQAIPRILEQARANLVEDARDLWLLGIRTQKEQGASLAVLGTRLAPHHPELLPEVERARQAVDAFRAWLEARLPGKTGPSGVGVQEYDWYLKNVHLVPYAWQDEVRLHERELGRALAHLALEEHQNRALPPVAPIATAVDWRRRMNDAVTEYVRFLRDERVVTVEDYMEPALRARIAPFGPPAERDFFAQVDAREPFLLRCHGYHWFDLARMEREPHPSPIRRVPLLYNIWDSRAEGLATAMEEMMASAGLLDGRPRSREMVYVMLAQRAARGLAGLRMHANQLSIEEAVRFAHERTPYGWLKLDGELVWGEQSLYLQQPGYGTCYLTGKALIEDLLAERAEQLGRGFSLQRFMDELNASDMIPVSLIRWEMTGREP
jgi:hypothetical protein